MTEPNQARKRGRPPQVAPSLASVTIPRPPFLYTLDQVGLIVSWPKARLHQRTFYIGRSLGTKSKDQLEAFSIAEPGEKPDWRVSEHELMRWLRRHGYEPKKES